MANETSANDGNAGGNKSAPSQRSGALPAVDFTTLVLSLRESALLHMGLAGDDAGEVAALQPDRDAARFQIEILALLQMKSQGNLTEDEDRLLRTVLYELRVAWLDSSKRPA